ASLLEMVLLLILQLVVTLFACCMCAPPKVLDVDTLDLQNYDINDLYWENLNLTNYEEIEVGMLAPLSTVPVIPGSLVPLDYTKESTLSPQPTEAPTPPSLDFEGPGLFGPDTGLGMPTCLMCLCIRSSVYCDDSHIDKIPLLPKETAYFYARFNKIKHVKATDFANLRSLKVIDLTGNKISDVEDNALRDLPRLRELILSDNQLQALPELPTSLKSIDVRNNLLTSAGIHPGAFQDLSHLEFVYLSHNRLDYVPTPLPESLRVLHLQYNNIQSLHEDTFCNRHELSYLRRALEDIRLDGNPINLSHYAQAYVCLPRLPVGRML
uniref:Opticin n=1 Tax=Scleropages formosus TaxID=113540 RepID=A0A8C9VY93_SCLFO